MKMRKLCHQTRSHQIYIYVMNKQKSEIHMPCTTLLNQKVSLLENLHKFNFAISVLALWSKYCSKPSVILRFMSVIFFSFQIAFLGNEILVSTSLCKQDDLLTLWQLCTEFIVVLLINTPKFPHQFHLKTSTSCSDGVNEKRGSILARHW